MGALDKGGTLNKIHDPLDLFGGQASAKNKERKEKAKKVKAAQEAHRQAVISDQRSTMAPWIKRGDEARARLQEKIKSGELDIKQFQYTPEEFAKDPGVAYRLKTGSETTGKYTAGSKDAEKALGDYGKNYAKNEYNNAYSRAYDTNAAHNTRAKIRRSGEEAAVAMGDKARIDMAGYEGGNAATAGEIELKNATQMGNNAMQYAQQRNNSMAAANSMAGMFMGGGSGGGGQVADPSTGYGTNGYGLRDNAWINTGGNP
jgi:hypothetical protein